MPYTKNRCLKSRYTPGLITKRRSRFLKSWLLLHTRNDFTQDIRIVPKHVRRLIPEYVFVSAEIE